jgi:hypothetical protein
MRPLHLFSASALTMAVLTAPLVLAPMQAAHAQFGIGVSITVAPPPLPIYEQPPLPAPGYLWTPGFWDYGDAGYYWVPGTWVEPPAVGLLWTPGYWGFNNGIYAFNRGYWGPHVGFYGGIDYGFGYGGFGFEGGEWRGGAFAYNRAVNNFGGVHVTNVYNRTVINNNVTRVSFNGPNGVNVHPRPEEEAFAHERHVDATSVQQQHFQQAARNPELRASVNHGAPAIAATARPADFRGPGVVAGRGAGEASRAPEPARNAGPGHTPEPAGAAAGAPHAAGTTHPALRPAGTGARPSGMEHTAGVTHPAGVTHSTGMVHTRPEGMAHTQPMATHRPVGMGGPGMSPGARPGMMAPHPAMQAPHPMAAPHPAAAPHAGGGHEGPGPHHG